MTDQTMMDGDSPLLWINKDRLERIKAGQGEPWVYTSDQSHLFECVPLFTHPAPSTLEASWSRHGICQFRVPGASIDAYAVGGLHLERHHECIMPVKKEVIERERLGGVVVVGQVNTPPPADLFDEVMALRFHLSPLNDATSSLDAGFVGSQEVPCMETNSRPPHNDFPKVSAVVCGLEVQGHTAAPVNHVATPADQIIGQIEELFPNWRAYRDLVDCITCELHELRQRAEAGR